MNGKRAKQLRRDAETITIGSPALAYNSYSTPIYSPIINPETGATVGSQKTSQGVPLTMSDCTRKVYKRLKVAG